MLASFPGMTVMPLDFAGNGDVLYIAWKTSSAIHDFVGKPSALFHNCRGDLTYRFLRRRAELTS